MHCRKPLKTKPVDNIRTGLESTRVKSTAQLFQFILKAIGALQGHL